MAAAATLSDKLMALGFQRWQIQGMSEEQKAEILGLETRTTSVAMDAIPRPEPSKPIITFHALNATSVDYRRISGALLGAATAVEVGLRVDGARDLSEILGRIGKVHGTPSTSVISAWKEDMQKGGIDHHLIQFDHRDLPEHLHNRVFNRPDGRPIRSGTFLGLYGGVYLEKGHREPIFPHEFQLPIPGKRVVISGGLKGNYCNDIPMGTKGNVEGVMVALPGPDGNLRWEIAIRATASIPPGEMLTFSSFPEYCEELMSVLEEDTPMADLPVILHPLSLTADGKLHGDISIANEKQISREAESAAMDTEESEHRSGASGGGSSSMADDASTAAISPAHSSRSRKSSSLEDAALLLSFARQYKG